MDASHKLKGDSKMTSPARAPLSRRLFLRAGLATAALPLLAACSPSAAPSPTAAPAAAAPAAPTNTPAPVPPTQAPAPTSTTAAAAPTNTPAAVPTNTTAPAATNTPAPAAAASGTFRLRLVTDPGKGDDKSFNQSAWEGVK